MHRMFCCLCLLLCARPSAAAPPEAVLNEYRENARRFSTLVVEAEAANDPNRVRTPETETVLKVLSDHTRMLVGEGHSIDELEVDLGICDTANRAVMSLVVFDLKDGIDPSGDPQRRIEDAARLMSRNLLFFQDELKRLRPFLFRCQAKAILKMQKFFADLPKEDLTETRRKGIAKMRSGIKIAYASATQGVFDEGIREGYRLAMLESLAETADAFAMVMPLKERETIAASARAASARVEKRYRGHLDKIAEAFGNETCEAICRIE